MYMPNGTKLPRLKTLYHLYQLKVTVVSVPAPVRASYSVACFLRTASLFFLVPYDLGLTNCGMHNPCNWQRPVRLYQPGPWFLRPGCTDEVLLARLNDIESGSNSKL